jgi:N-acetylated-alpha-linked acidic dipeptidase
VQEGELPALEEALEAVRADVSRLGEEAGWFESAAAVALEQGIDAGGMEAANRHIRSAVRAFRSERALPGQPGLRQILYATDPDDGYATLALPGIRLALRHEDMAEAGLRIEELGEHIAAATAFLAAARRALESRSVEDR